MFKCGKISFQTLIIKRTHFMSHNNIMFARYSIASEQYLIIYRRQNNGGRKSTN